MNTSNDTHLARRRRRKHSAEFKAKVVAACRQPGISMAAVALANGLNANLLRRWVVTAERTGAAHSVDGVKAVPVVGALADVNAAFVPVQVERRAVASAQEIAIELRRGATVVKIGWPLAAVSDCAVWLRELLR